MINLKLIPAVVVVKPASTAKADLEVMAKQVAQITTACVPQNIYVEDIIVSFTGIKDISKRIASLTEHKEIHAVLVYNVKQIANSEKEMLDFIKEMDTWYHLKVICFR